MSSIDFSDCDDSTRKTDLQFRHYALLKELQNMSRDLPRNFQQRLPCEFLSSLANSLLDKTVFDIVKGLKDIQQMTEKNLFDRRMQVVNSHKATREKMLKRHKEKLNMESKQHPHNMEIVKMQQLDELQKLGSWQDAEKNRLDMKIIMELDQNVSDQQVTLEKVGVPGFFVSNKEQDIKLQMYLLQFISILAAKDGTE